jgi:predicted glycosyltransferase
MIVSLNAIVRDGTSWEATKIMTWKLDSRSQSLVRAYRHTLSLSGRNAFLTILRIGTNCLMLT